MRNKRINLLTSNMNLNDYLNKKRRKAKSTQLKFKKNERAKQKSSLSNLEYMTITNNFSFNENQKEVDQKIVINKHILKVLSQITENGISQFGYTKKMNENEIESDKFKYIDISNDNINTYQAKNEKMTYEEGYINDVDENNILDCYQKVKNTYNQRQFNKESSMRNEYFKRLSFQKIDYVLMNSNNISKEKIVPNDKEKKSFLTEKFIKY